MTYLSLMLILYWLKKSLVIRKAIAIQKVCREMPIGLKDYELIVGIPTMSSLGFGHVFLLGYVHTVFLDVGNQYMFPSVVASAIGGISFAGESGSYVGTFGGALVYTFLLSFLVTVNMDESLRKALFGLILILLLVVYSRSTRER